MIQKKICMVGASGVGKTSLVTRYVKSIFSDKYLTTVGVKIDKKPVKVGSQDINLILWDLAGEDEFVQLQTSYLRGSAGYILVADGMRSSSLIAAFTLQVKVQETVGTVPFLLVINKDDLKDRWEITDASLRAPMDHGWIVRYTSAKSGSGVEDMFQILAEKMVDG